MKQSILARLAEGVVLGGGSIACHVREMARALGKDQEQPVWQPNPDAPMSETEFNWQRRQG